MLSEQMQLNHQIMNINQQMQAFFQMWQALGLRSQQPFINHPQNDKDENKDEDESEHGTWWYYPSRLIHELLGSPLPIPCVCAFEDNALFGVVK